MRKFEQRWSEGNKAMRRSIYILFLASRHSTRGSGMFTRLEGQRCALLSLKIQRHSAIVKK